MHEFYHGTEFMEPKNKQLQNLFTLKHCEYSASLYVVYAYTPIWLVFTGSLFT